MESTLRFDGIIDNNVGKEMIKTIIETALCRKGILKIRIVEINKENPNENRNKLPNNK